MYLPSVRNFLLTICIVLFVSCATATLPDYIKKCQAGNEACIKKNIDTVFSTKYQGDEKFGLTQLDPLKVAPIVIKQDEKNPVNVELSFSNPVIHGFKNTHALKVKGFGKSPDGRHDILVNIPEFTLEADYKIKGKVLVLPIVGEGKSKLTFVKPQVKISLEGGSRTENGQLYMDVKSVTLDILPERITIHMDNLFNGDKALGDNVNKFLNENWREIYADMKEVTMKELAKPIKENAEKVFKTIPYTDLFEI